MGYASPALVGRLSELETLERRLEEARRGQGSVSLIVGDAGIGKSRLAEEFARRAADSGALCLWGRAWEEGSAPAYWPWIQALRVLLREREEIAELPSGPQGSPLGQLLPELRVSSDEPASGSGLEPDAARFLLFDAVVGALSRPGAKDPIVLILEDLHAADASSLHLLSFLAHQVRGLPIAVVGTARPTKANDEANGALLAKLRAIGSSLPLRPLGREEAGALLDALDVGALDASLMNALEEATEGNPLLLEEAARLIHDGRSASRSTGEMVESIRAGVDGIVRLRLVDITDSTRETLAAASVFGREFSLEELATEGEATTASIAEGLSEGVKRSLIVECAPGRYRFSHSLLREALHGELPLARRQAIHRTRIRSLESEPSPPFARIAWHHRELGAGDPEAEIAALGRAAADALAKLAFEDAAGFHERAYQLAKGCEGRGAETIEHGLALGRAQSLGGDGEAGRATFLEIAELAREKGDSELLARAALGHGAILSVGKRDGTLTGLLREALERLEPDARALRARVQARLAAALQPADDARVPIEMAHAAIALARESGDAEALLEALRNGCSAMMDLSPVLERVELNLEHAELAARLDRPVDELRGRMRLLLDRYELGDITGALEALEACDRLASRLAHPVYRWRAVAMRAMVAAWRGRFDDADVLHEEARALAERARDGSAGITLGLQEAAHLALRGELEAAIELLPRLPTLVDEATVVEADIALFSSAILFGAGRRREASERLRGSLVEAALASGDRTTLEFWAKIIQAQGDIALAARVRERLEPVTDQNVHGGVLMLTWQGPVSWSLGLMAAVEGDFTRAERLLSEALSRCRATGALPHAGWIACELAELLAGKGDPASLKRAARLLDEASEAAESMRIEALRRRSERTRRAIPRLSIIPPAPSSSTAAPASPSSVASTAELTLDGELWTLRQGERCLRLKNSKGMRILAKLMNEPGREFHVLDLGDAPADGVIDAGDSGESIDEEAKAAYRARVVELRAELAEAEEWNDPGRVERARAELEALMSELSRGVGLGGRERRDGGASERARVNVQRRLKDALRRIAAQDASLGKHLERSIKTGRFCSYEP